MTDTASSARARFLEIWGELSDLRSALFVLEWDSEVKRPPKGQAARGRVLSLLTGISHQKLTSEELSDVVGACEEEVRASQGDSEDDLIFAAQVREARRTVDRATCIPERLAREIAETTSAAIPAWTKARKESDFSIFQPLLQRMIDLHREEAAALQPNLPEGASLYDALLDGFEPGAREEELIPLFADLRRELTPLVREVAECGNKIDESPALGDFSKEAQIALGREVAAAVGFDFEAGRLDASTHPFCIGIDRGDVRMTWRADEKDFRQCFFGVLHEAGHGLYEQGLPEAYSRTPIGGAVSLGIHESQSRLWENQVGRSRGFWQWLMPRFREAFPEAKRFEVDDMWPALHVVEPSLIRTEADEVTYSLHVAIRFEIERALIRKDLEVADLPGAWDDAYEEMLGVRPPDAAQGVLQDIHWANGLFGYFPTYTLGTIISAQLYDAASEALGDLDAAFAAGEFSGLLEWLRENVHRHGSRYPATELVRRATGSGLDAGPLLRELRENTRVAYGL